MNHADMQPHRALFFVLLTMFEVLLVASIVATWTIDPRRMRGYHDVAGIAGLFGVVGLLAIWWLLRRVMPRLARIALLNALVGFVLSMLLPAIP